MESELICLSDIEEVDTVCSCSSPSELAEHIRTWSVLAASTLILFLSNIEKKIVLNKIPAISFLTKHVFIFDFIFCPALSK
jgi:hypothetical protein